MKKLFKILKEKYLLASTIILFFLLPVIAVFAINSWSEGYRFDDNVNLMCVKVASSNGSDYLIRDLGSYSGPSLFVPTKTIPEWDAFSANKPSGVVVQNTNNYSGRVCNPVGGGVYWLYYANECGSPTVHISNCTGQFCSGNERRQETGCLSLGCTSSPIETCLPAGTYYCNGNERRQSTSCYQVNTAITECRSNSIETCSFGCVSGTCNPPPSAGCYDGNGSLHSHGSVFGTMYEDTLGSSGTGNCSEPYYNVTCNNGTWNGYSGMGDPYLSCGYTWP